MPQLMPFFWINSIFMVFFILISLSLLYYYKNYEMMNYILFKDNIVLNCNFLW